MLTVPVWLVWLTTYKGSIGVTARREGLAATFFGALTLLFYATYAYGFNRGLRQAGLEVRTHTDRWTADLRIYDCHITAAFPEPALYYGVNYAGDRTALYKHELSLQYPDWFQVDWEKGLRDWYAYRSADSVLSGRRRVLFYSTADSFDIRSLRLGAYETDSVLESYTHPVSGESAYLVTFRNRE
jgi:hypothetical protein